MNQHLRLRSYFNRLLKQYSVYGLLLIYQTFEVKKPQRLLRDLGDKTFPKFETLEKLHP